MAKYYPWNKSGSLSAFIIFKKLLEYMKKIKRKEEEKKRKKRKTKKEILNINAILDLNLTNVREKFYSIFHCCLFLTSIQKSLYNSEFSHFCSVSLYSLASIINFYLSGETQTLPVKSNLAHFRSFQLCLYSI